MSKISKKTSKHIDHQSNLFIGILAAAILIIGLSSLFFFKQKTNIVKPIQVEKNSISVSNQKPSSKVLVDKVVLENPGFIVIRLDDEGELGKVIGASKYIAKTSENIEINLYESTKTGQKVIAEIRKDDGDKRFNTQKDLVVKDSKENRVTSEFIIN